MANGSNGKKRGTVDAGRQAILSHAPLIDWKRVTRVQPSGQVQSGHNMGGLGPVIPPTHPMFQIEPKKRK